MNDKTKYAAPPSDGIIKRFLKIVFKTPYGQLPVGEKIVKLIIQLAIAAVVIYVAYIILKVIITIIIAIIALILIVTGLFESDKKIEIVDKHGNRERYRKY